MTYHNGYAGRWSCWLESLFEIHPLTTETAHEWDGGMAAHLAYLLKPFTPHRDRMPYLRTINTVSTRGNTWLKK